ncbi:MAG: hypothetical protein IID28_04445 [Planctomycetes bacterium]|nr:hypothetical protein [Planctomycetota bacterium]
MRNLLPARVLAAVAVFFAAAVGTGNGDPSSAAAGEAVRGMTVSCQTWGWEWGTDEMVDTMRQLKAMGVNWIAIHPYAGIRGDGTVGSRRRDNAGNRHLLRPIREAHALGLKIMIKPHLAYWGSPFRWRGDITFETPEQWQRFFTDYRQWIVRLAEICHEADAFVVGTELDRTITHADQWREIITQVRARFDGPLTYAANWTNYTRVPFWKELDVIGVQSYFPLTDQPGLPDEHDLELAWTRLLTQLTAFSREQDRPVVLCELGYPRSANAAIRPWEGREGGQHADEIQRRCMAAALRAVEAEDVIVGAFLWKWFARPTRHANFLMSTPSMRAVIAEHWQAAPAGGGTPVPDNQ